MYFQRKQTSKFWSKIILETVNHVRPAGKVYIKHKICGSRNKSTLIKAFKNSFRVWMSKLLFSHTIFGSAHADSYCTKRLTIKCFLFSIGSNLLQETNVVLCSLHVFSFVYLLFFPFIIIYFLNTVINVL